MFDRAQDTQLILKLSRPGDLMESTPQEALEFSREESNHPSGRGVVNGGQNDVRLSQQIDLDISHLAVVRRPF